MWYAQHRKKRILPVRVVDYFIGWEKDITIMTFLSQEYDLRFDLEPTVILCHQFGDGHRDYDCAKIFCAGEPWGYCPDDYDFKITFDYEESDNAIRFPLYGYYFPETTLCKTITPDAARNLLAKKTKFCNFVYSNGWPQQRIEFVKLLSRYKQVDCCGRLLNNTDTFIEGTHSGPEKIRFLSDYKFTIAFENTVKVGYTSEKIAAPMAAHSIPIYYGNLEVPRDFNPKSFVNVHDYPSFDEAVARIIELDQSDDLYVTMMVEPWFHNGIPTPSVDTNRLMSHLVRWIEERRLSLEPDKTNEK